MHISEGILSAPVLLSGAVVSVVAVTVGLKKLDIDKIPQASILSAAFFVASLVHVPLGPSSVHLILNGIVGIILGWGAVPAIMIALVLQGVLFQFGGITTLGVNTVIMAVPAVISYYIFKPFIFKKNVISSSASFACGFFSVFLSGVLVALFLIMTEEGFVKIAYGVFLAHLPVMIIEGFVTMFCIGFLKKVNPELLPETTLCHDEILVNDKKGVLEGK